MKFDYKWEDVIVADFLVTGASERSHDNLQKIILFIRFFFSRHQAIPQSLNWKRARKFLLEFLPRKGPAAIDKFITSLEETEGQEDIAAELKNYMAAADEVDSSLLKDEQIIKELAQG